MREQSHSRRLVGAAAALALVVAACSSSGSSASPSASAAASTAASSAPASAAASNPASVAPSQAASAPTSQTLTIWHSTGDSKALLNLYTAYAAASGNKLNIVDIPNDTYTTAVQTKWSTGERPDILEYWPTSQDMAQLNMTENMVDLSSLAFVAAEGDLSKTAGSLGGKVYGAVLGPIASFGAYYNKTAFTKAGVTVPTNYDDLIAQCKTIAASGVTPVFIGGGSEFPVMMLNGFTYMADYNAGDAYGLGVKDGSIKVNAADSPIVAGLTVLTTLKDAGCLNKDAGTATFQDAIKAVSTGKAALTVLPSDFIGMFYDGGATDDTVGFGPISAHKGVTAFSPSLQGTYFVPKSGDATKEAAAQGFIDWVTGAGYQAYVDEAKIAPTMSTATAPSLTGMSAALTTMLSAPGATLSFNSSIPGFGNFGKVSVKVLVGQSTPQQGGDEFQTFIDQARAAQN